MLCLVEPVNARFLSLLNSVKYESSLAGQQFLISANYLFCAVTVFIFSKFLVMQLQFQNFSELFSYAAKVFFVGINSA